MMAFALVAAGSLASQAMEKMNHSGHNMAGSTDHGAMNHEANSAESSMDHSNMDHGSMGEGGTFTRMEMVDGIHVQFEVMDLASMKMKDPEGNTHHIMVSFTKDTHKLENIAGKVKVIAPSGKEQVGTLKNYGSGVFAANFTFNEPGDWGVICLFKDDQQKHTVKFWYPHKMK